MATMTDFPMPCPEMARRTGATGSWPLNALRRTSSPMPEERALPNVRPGIVLERPGLAPRVGAEHEPERIVVRRRDPVGNRQIFGRGRFCNC
jgi:hypothetical protein